MPAAAGAPEGDDREAVLLLRQPRAAVRGRRADGGRAQLGDEQQLARHVPEQRVERMVRRGLDEHDEVGRARLLEQPGRALAVGRIGGDGLEDLSAVTAQPAHDGARESVGGSDHEGVHAFRDAWGPGTFPAAGWITLIRMGYSVLPAEDAFWRPSNMMGVLNTDLGKQLVTTKLGARLWRLRPGQSSTRHRHYGEEELYVVLEGTGRMRVEDELLTLSPLSAVRVAPDRVRQVFNDTDADALWLVVGAPPELANTLEMTEAQLAHMYPDGPKALPPELT
jgi:uncharacterized cupin superfamily protein